MDVAGIEPASACLRFGSCKRRNPSTGYPLERTSGTHATANSLVEGAWSGQMDTPYPSYARGRGDTARTCGLLAPNQVLFLLSYTPMENGDLLTVPVDAPECVRTSVPPLLRNHA